MNYHKLSWKQLARDSLRTASKLSKVKIDKIISISRGGLVVSRIISDILQLQISHIVISSYWGNKKQGKPYLSEVSGLSCKNQTVLLVDEVSDSGDTLKHAMSFLEHFSPQQIITLSPYIKPKTCFVPDYYARSINGWIIFPYDIRETYDNFVKELGSEEKALIKMREVGFEDWEVDAL